MENPQQFDLFKKPQIESDENIVQAAEEAAIQNDEAESEQQRIYEAMKEEGYFPEKKKKTGRKAWLELGRKLTGEDKQEELLK